MYEGEDTRTDHVERCRLPRPVRTQEREYGACRDTKADVVDDATALAHLDTLRASGVQVCVEGFGTHEAPTHLWAQLPVDLVRVDAQALARGPLRSSTLLRLTVETAHTFGWQVVATGATAPDQLAALAEVGCRYAQGPMSRRAIAALTDAGPSAPVPAAS